MKTDKSMVKKIRISLENIIIWVISITCAVIAAAGILGYEIQFHGGGDECTYSVPHGSEAAWNDSDAQTAARERFSKAELVDFVESLGFRFLRFLRRNTCYFQTLVNKIVPHVLRMCMGIDTKANNPLNTVEGKPGWRRAVTNNQLKR